MTCLCGQYRAENSKDAKKKCKYCHSRAKYMMPTRSLDTYTMSLEGQRRCLTKTKRSKSADRYDGQRVQGMYSMSFYKILFRLGWVRSGQFFCDLGILVLRLWWYMCKATYTCTTLFLEIGCYVFYVLLKHGYMGMEHFKVGTLWILLI